MFIKKEKKKKNRIQENVNTLDVSWAGMELGFEPGGAGSITKKSFASIDFTRPKNAYTS